MSRKYAELMLTLDKKAQEPLYRQLYVQIASAIERGRLAEGDRLPSIRRLSVELAVSHTTIEQAYVQLATEGFVTNKPRSGFEVNAIDTDYFAIEGHDAHREIEALAKARSTDAFYAENRTGSAVRYDFSYANLQPDSFPATIWRKLTGEVLYCGDCPDLARYSYTDEPSSLATALCSLLARTRGCKCAPEQVLVQAGTDGALAMILQLFDRGHDLLGMEEPGYPTMHEVARRQGFSMVPIVAGADIEKLFRSLEEHRPKVIFLTPSHQFPTGALLPLDARIRLLRWAEANDAYVIEDDSCNELRYATRPVPSLQSLDVYGRVVYLGNVSKVLSPGLRVAFVVLPPRLLKRYWDLSNFAHPPVSWLTQEVLARFISEGHWDAHVRKVAHANQRRHDELTHCLQVAFGDAISVSGADTGMHLYARIANGMDEEELLASALREGAKVYGTTRMWFSRPMPDAHVMLGFSSIALGDIGRGVEALYRAWIG